MIIVIVGNYVTLQQSEQTLQNLAELSVCAAPLRLRPDIAHAQCTPIAPSLQNATVRSQSRILLWPDFG